MKNLNLSVEQKQQIVATYLSGKSQNKTAIFHNVSRATVSDILTKRHVHVRRQRTLTTNESESACGRYVAGENANLIARSFGVDPATIINHLKRSGIKRRSLSEIKRVHQLNEQVFANLSNEAAYWIGFLMADGCISKIRSTWAVSASASVVDEQHLHKLRKFVGTTAPIAVKDGIAVLCIYSNALAASLVTYGVTQRKSFTAKAFGLDGYWQHFWRGVVDGNGCLGLGAGRGKEKKYARLHLAGSRQLMTQFQEFVHNTSPACQVNVRPQKTIWQIGLKGSHAFSVIKRLYENCTIALARKASIAKYLFDNCDSRGVIAH